MKITCDTEISELVKVSDVKKFFDTFDSDVTLKVKKITNAVSQEMNRGFSSKNCKVAGKAVLNVKAKNVVNCGNSVTKKIYDIRTSALTAAENQRKKELQKLGTAIDEKIDELNTLVGKIKVAIQNAQQGAASGYKVGESVGNLAGKAQKISSTVGGFITGGPIGGFIGDIEAEIVKGFVGFELGKIGAAYGAVTSIADIQKIKEKYIKKRKSVNDELNSLQKSSIA